MCGGELVPVLDEVPPCPQGFLIGERRLSERVKRNAKKIRWPETQPPDVNFLFTQTESLDQRAVLVNVFFGVVAQQALALADHRQEGAAGGVVLLVDAQVGRQAFDAVGEQGDLYFGVAGVGRFTPILGDDFSDFLLVVIDCHFVRV